MGTAFERAPPEVVLTGREYEFFANMAPECELLPDCNVLVYFAVERGKIAEVKAFMFTSPTGLARMGRKFLHSSGLTHNDLIMRIVAPHPH